MVPPSRKPQLTFFDSSSTSSALLALNPPSPPVTEVPSIEGSGASPFRGALYSDSSESEPLEGKLEVGLESSAANDIIVKLLVVAVDLVYVQLVEARGRKEGKETIYFSLSDFLHSTRNL